MTGLFEIFRSPITLRTAAAGSYVNGVWQEGTFVNSTITASIQPLKGEEMQSLPVGRRLSEAYKMYTSTEVNTVRDSGDNTNADRVIFNGQEYEIWEVMPWQNNVNFAVVNHYKYLILRINS